MNEQSIFLEALDFQPGAERQRFLDDACGSDSALRARVEDLLLRHSEDSSFLESHQASPFATRQCEPIAGAVEASSQETVVGLSGDDDDRGPEAIQPGSLVRYIGDYEILSEVARGGMGVVYKARQVRLKRIVALKMILSGEFASEADIRRFHTEAESAAKLDHPNIVPVYEVGEHQGIHYFSMGFVDGPPMSSRIAEAPYHPRESAIIVRQLAEAVQYAHDHGVIHRDLKPGNVLIDRSGVPRITDFGLAKQTKESSSLTGTGFILGTPAYMPPEQATGRVDLTREQADIYSLGAILYAAITGRPPFQADNALETLRQVAQQEPVSPRQLNSRIPVDLETICLKCLEKQIHRRYQTARELSADLGRFLDNQPILARPVRTYERVWKWCRRNPVVTALLATVAASLLIGTVVSTYFAIEADRRADENFALAVRNRDLAEKETLAKEAAEASRRIAEDKERVAAEQTRIALTESTNLSLNEALKLCEQDQNPAAGLLWVAAAYERAVEAGDVDLADACRGMASLWLPQTMRLVNVLNSTRRTGAIYGKDDLTILQVDWAWEHHNSPSENERSVSEALKHGMMLLDARTGETLEQMINVRSPTPLPTMNADRSLILLLDDQHQPRLWSLPEKRWIGKPLTPSGRIERAQFSGDGWRLVTGTLDGKVEFWNVTTGESAGITIHHEQPANNSAFAFCLTPTGAMIYTAGRKGDIRIWDPNNGQEIQARRDDIRGSVQHMVWSPTHGPFAVFRSSPNRIMTHWGNEQTQTAAEVSTQLVRHMNYSSDGRWLAEVGDESLLFIRDGLTALPACAPANQGRKCWSVQFNSRNDRVVLAELFGAIEEWELAPRLHRRYQRENIDSNQRQFLYRDPRDNSPYRVSIGQNGYQKISRMTPEESTEGLTELPQLLFTSIARGGKSLVGVTEDNHEAFSVDIATGITHRAGSRHAEKVRSFHQAPGGEVFATCCEQEFRMWRSSDARPIGEPVAVTSEKYDPTVQFTRDGTLVSMCQRGRNAECYLLSTQDESPSRESIAIPGMTLAIIDSSGQRLLVGFWGRLELWQRNPLEKIKVLGEHDLHIFQIGCSMDNTFAFTLGGDRTVRVWDLATGERVGRPMVGIDSEAKLSLRPDGKWLAVDPQGKGTQHWHIASGRRLGSPVMRIRPGNLIWQGFAEFGYSHDSKEYVAWSADNTYPLLGTPVDPVAFRTFLEVWTGQRLDGNDIRALTSQQWAKRRDQLQQLAPEFLAVAGAGNKE